jgi:hypothetical protein
MRTTDGLEIAHPSYDTESRSMALNLMQSMRIAGIGASDAHDLREVGRCRTVFEQPSTSAQILCEEIRNCRVTARRGSEPVDVGFE